MNQYDSTDNMKMHNTERVMHSKVSAANAATARLRLACNEAGTTIRGLAKEARLRTRHKRLSQAQLSLAAQGMRPIDADLATWIAERTGYAATSANWPKLRTA